MIPLTFMEFCIIAANTRPEVRDALENLRIAVTLAHGAISARVMMSLVYAEHGNTIRITAKPDNCGDEFLPRRIIVEVVPTLRCMISKHDFNKIEKVLKECFSIVINDNASFDLDLVPGHASTVALMIAELSDNPTVEDALAMVAEAAVEGV